MGSSVTNSRIAIDTLARLSLRTQQHINKHHAWEQTLHLTISCLPVEGGHGADGQQQVEQALEGVGQAVVLLQQVGRSGEVAPRQHVHHHHVPHGEARQEAMTVQTQHPAVPTTQQRLEGLEACLSPRTGHAVTTHTHTHPATHSSHGHHTPVTTHTLITQAPCMHSICSHQAHT